MIMANGYMRSVLCFWYKLNLCDLGALEHIQRCFVERSHHDEVDQGRCARHANLAHPVDNCPRHYCCFILPQDTFRHRAHRLLNCRVHNTLNLYHGQLDDGIDVMVNARH
jgi:hypothetical protein